MVKTKRTIGINRNIIILYMEIPRFKPQCGLCGKMIKNTGFKLKAFDKKII